MDIDLNWDGKEPAEAASDLSDFADALVDQLEAAAEEIGLRIQRTAQRTVNVDTGRLRASIEHEVERIGEAVVAATVGSNVEYAPFHEFDYPYLRPAFEEHRDDIVERFEQAVNEAAEVIQ